MQVIDQILTLREARRRWQVEGKTIGFVPTMGNLHHGHLKLVKEAKQKCDIVVASIFVNPLQFGPDEDLASYPRTLEHDLAALESLGVDVVFTPSVHDIYPRGLEQQTFVEVPGISYMICGASRPGHFRGMTTIVCKLFNMVQPNHAFFGEKDYQQLQIVKAMVTDLSMNLTVHGVPTVREADGLAMSSRNNYLTTEEREMAPRLYKLLREMADLIHLGRRDYSKIISEYKQKLVEAGFSPDYIEIRAADSLLHPSHEDEQLVILIAAFLGKARLIDNIRVDLED
ncbi:Pantoate--beta-alanine ligase (AMP-forming) [Saliniradius amylolyticus]|uniref:Pantothenate synthetase n=1 Tax=Saliniradius amylolyticus TaxID=2183582 RepID=A0A2S2DZT6_9ALTE|nr:pantoate--beta-alanine ligase [Saliniradius amylolyticus]AWL10869.1 Pantoate--beta-alanine ligase (AMP-forming) [Saliniradius amylolyticus]